MTSERNDVPMPTSKTSDDIASSGTIPMWDVSRLTNGGLEATILHDGSVYRLRITSNRKLILTK